MATLPLANAPCVTNLNAKGAPGNPAC
jgi:hypothetical protein